MQYFYELPDSIIYTIVMPWPLHNFIKFEIRLCEEKKLKSHEPKASFKSHPIWRNDEYYDAGNEKIKKCYKRRIKIESNEIIACE